MIRISLISFSVFLALLTTPLIIHFLYSGNGPLLFTHWEPVDIMMYLGAAIGGFATLCAIPITIIHENKKRREDKVAGARVFISFEPNIFFRNYDDFQEYANKANISKLYYFNEWFPVEKNIEIQWIKASQDSSSSSAPERFAIFVITNPADKYIYNVIINVEVTEHDETGAEVGNKKYDPISISVLPQKSKISFPLPIFSTLYQPVKCVSIEYKTQMKEKVIYEFKTTGNNGSEWTSTESYYINNKKTPEFSVSISRSPFNDLRKNE